MMNNTSLPYSGVTSSYNHKWNPEQPNSPDTKQGLRKVWFLDAQWSTCPVEVENQVKDLWRFYELGNDNYIFKTSVDELLGMVEEEVTVERWKGMPDGWVEGPLEVDYLVQYIREHDIPDDEDIIIHWWW
jgi:hypothetical protein